jgi:sterol desaturase/sphingolipid hydroxylase (fatty acid hydroxylase superfamily)
MDAHFLRTLLASYRLDLSLFAFVAIMVVNRAAAWALPRMVPTIAEAQRRNDAAFREQLKKPEYLANVKWNRPWGLVNTLVIFGLILPWCLTLQPQPWWRVLRDIVVILMFYDFFYYLTHRFLFHKEGFLGGPLMSVHAIHHRQHNPCRFDSGYLHPVETAIGMGLYAVSIFVLSRFLGGFHVVTIVLTWIAFTQINLHNHDLWEEDRFPFRYLAYASKMHHNHHTRFTGGNFATITVLYDWMFGTLDNGKGRKG